MAGEDKGNLVEIQDLDQALKKYHDQTALGLRQEEFLENSGP